MLDTQELPVFSLKVCKRSPKVLVFSAFITTYSNILLVCIFNIPSHAHISVRILHVYLHEAFSLVHDVKSHRLQSLNMVVQIKSSKTMSMGELALHFVCHAMTWVRER